MPFTYRDKPNLADRLRGKSGEEILNELKSDLDTQGRRMFFDSPSWRSRHSNSAFPRGFPFDDDQNRINIRTYLDEIATRHPEFADQLRERPWSEDFVDPSFKKSRSDIRSNQGNEASGSSQKPVEEKESTQNLTNFGLRNTVPLGPNTNLEQNRHQRSMSAPPENRGVDKNKRFVTKCEIPVMNNPPQESVQIKPDLAGRGPQESAQPKGGNAPNVRVIPIQVEGRDTPLVNTNIDTASNFAGESFMEPSFEGRLPRDFGSYQRHSPRFGHKERAPTPPQYQYAPQYQQYAPPSQHFMPPQQPQFMSQQHFAPPPPEQQAFGQQHPHPHQHPPPHPHKPPAPPPPQQHQQQHPSQQQQQQQQQQQSQPQPQPQPHRKQAPRPPPQGDEVDSKLPQPKPEPLKDPIEKVQSIQKDVEELMKQVEAFNGNSRTDKQYLMLDEFLTRQLLLLDVIDTEGKENVRQARKDTIRSIQRCISTLENKVPLVEKKEPGSESKGTQEGAAESGDPQPMNVDNTQENTPVENKECQKMEVDQQANSELPQDQQIQGKFQQPIQQEQQQEQKKEENPEII